MKFHKLSELFPLMVGKEFDELVKDIKQNGLKEPIYLYEDQILDGRNRWNACKEAGIEVRTKEYKGSEPEKFVISMNIHRRHLNESQRALIANKLANMPKHLHKTDRQVCLSQTEAAKLLNVSERSVRNARLIQKQAPEEIKNIESGKRTINNVKKVVDAKAREICREKAASAVKADRAEALSKVCYIDCEDFRTWLPKIKGIDAIITDPPYIEKYLPLYEDLARLAKDVPLVAVMCGQAWLPEVMKLMCKHLEYRWTLCYLTTAGGVATDIIDRGIACHWKPVLLFGNKKTSKKYIHDLFKSEGRDKDNHEWGQDVGGLCDLVSRLTEPGQLVVDPFTGGGSTAVACVKLNRRFAGCDINEKDVKTSLARCIIQAEEMKL